MEYKLNGDYTRIEQYPEFRLLELVEEALEAHILQELTGQGERYEFSHALVQQTLLEGLSTSRKVRLHARIGEALETLYSDEPGDHAAELAYHFAEALPVTGPEKLVRYSGLAGERALESYAHEEALGHFQKGLTAKGLDLEGSALAPDDESAALLFGLGRSLAATSSNSASRTKQAIECLKRAFEHYRRDEQPERALQVAKYPVRHRIGFQVGLKDLVGPAVELASPDSPDAARLLSIYGRVLGLEEGRYDEAREAFGRALTIAELSGDVSLEMAALAEAANVHYFHARHQEALRTSLRAIELSQRVDDPRTEVAARYIAVLALRVTGDLQDAVQHASAMLDLAERIRDHFWLATSCWMSETVSSRNGDWHAARSFSDRGLLVSPDAATLLSTRVMFEYQVGRFDEGARFLERLQATANAAPNWPVYDHAALAITIPVVVRITEVADRFDIAEKAAETLISSPQVTPAFSMHAETGLALIAVTRGDRTACAKWYDRVLSAEEFYAYPMVEDRLLGLLAQAIGNLDEAMDHFEDALAFCRPSGRRPELAWTCHDYADTLLLRDRPGDQQKAKSMLEESLSISTDLDMRPLMERVVARKERAESQPIRTPAYPDGLSSREEEVLRLIATGKTDREIGEELFISVRTVGHHEGNILIKTRAANRAEAATYAAMHGITVIPGPD